MGAFGLNVCRNNYPQTKFLISKLIHRRTQQTLMNAVTMQGFLVQYWAAI